MKPAVLISTVADGNMLIPSERDNPDIKKNRNKFLSKHHLDPSESVRVNIIYGGDNYRRYREVNLDQAGSDDLPPADALVTTDRGLALFLPIADCVGTVLFDPTNEVLMLSHLGRHSLEQFGGKASVEFLVNKYDSKPEDLLIWLSPSPGKKAYPVFAFDGSSLKEVALEQLTSAGVLVDNITDNPADTATDSNYYSHSAFLRGEKPDDGRFAIVAILPSDQQ